MLTYGSVCSGIESASVAWEPLGMRPTWFAEVEPFPSAVLAYHWPHVPNLGDMCGLPALIRAGVIQAPDGPRYKAIGNSKARPVIQWIGIRILKEVSK